MVEQHRILQFARISDQAVVADDDILTDVRIVPDLAIAADDRRTFDHRPILHERALADEHLLADISHSVAMIVQRRPQIVLQILLDLAQRLPSVVASLKNAPMLRLLQIEQIRWLEHNAKLAEY